MKKRIQHKKDVTHPEYPHGLSGHRYGCRCEVCCEAKRDYDVTYRTKKNPNYKPTHKRLASRITHGKDVNHPDFPHGEFRGYRAGCRCIDCKIAKADYNLNQKGV